ncbi:DoxX protein [Soonwooa buanensis]|uniref:DoxX protein n=1 Tax=Soonwooa buanensis TaxID=619805 RepID=A0A1T5GLC9_9FLAO|nr:DoxX family membrane protein [Soonwooa buanensis]SKC09213.1 DoxX protein [Soonwooa buanensis]
MFSTKLSIAQLFLRIALAVTMLSAVADRFGCWGNNAVWGNWTAFEGYTRTLTFFLPNILSKIGAYFATFCEVVFSILLLIGFKTKVIAYATSILLLSFGIAMTIALGVKAPLDYSVWTSVAAAFLLAAQNKFPFSIDNLINKNK